MANAGQERRRTRVTCCAPAVPWLLGCSALRAQDRCARQARGLFCRAREALRAHFGIAILEPSLNLTLCDAKTSGDSNVVRNALHGHVTVQIAGFEFFRFLREKILRFFGI